MLFAKFLVKNCMYIYIHIVCDLVSYKTGIFCLPHTTTILRLLLTIQLLVLLTSTAYPANPNPTIMITTIWQVEHLDPMHDTLDQLRHVLHHIAIPLVHLFVYLNDALFGCLNTGLQPLRLQLKLILLQALFHERIEVLLFFHVVIFEALSHIVTLVLHHVLLPPNSTATSRLNLLLGIVRMVLTRIIVLHGSSVSVKVDINFGVKILRIQIVIVPSFRVRRIRLGKYENEVICSQFDRSLRIRDHILDLSKVFVSIWPGHHIFAQSHLRTAPHPLIILETVVVDNFGAIQPQGYHEPSRSQIVKQFGILFVNELPRDPYVVQVGSFDLRKVLLPYAARLFRLVRIADDQLF